LQRIRTNTITRLEQAQRGAAGGLLRFRGGGDLGQHSATGAMVTVLIGIDDVAIKRGQVALADAIEKHEELDIPPAAHGFSCDKRSGNAFGRCL
jgi:hypothetical protein